jgi:hypothetical protein
MLIAMQSMESLMISDALSGSRWQQTSGDHHAGKRIAFFADSATGNPLDRAMLTSCCHVSRIPCMVGSSPRFSGGQIEAQVQRLPVKQFF